MHLEEHLDIEQAELSYANFLTEASDMWDLYFFQCI